MHIVKMLNFNLSASRYMHREGLVEFNRYIIASHPMYLVGLVCPGVRAVVKLVR